MRRIHPAMLILATLEMEKTVRQAWEEAEERSPEEEKQLMKQKTIDEWANCALQAVGKILTAAKVKPIDCILTGDIALYLHGYLDEPPAMINVFVKEHILDKIAASEPPEIPFGFEATASSAILDTEPYVGFRLITIDQILKVIKKLPSVHQAQYANIINDIEKKINDRTKTRDLECIKAKSSQPAKKAPKRDAWEFNPHAVSGRRTSHREETNSRPKKDWDSKRRK